MLAKAELFDPSFMEQSSESDALNAARRMRAQGYPATALYLLKQTVLDCFAQGDGAYRALLAEMASVYEDLGRPLLAQSTRETLAQL